ncbi:glycosyltransferase family 2 protein [Leptolyngbya sp. AN03gr2]|uniref:glycosyltransferase family 2 protein n=1 Tax=unclassified Leptolyngbya TaxID=2650499 RepID=UPI003D32298D
MIQPLFSIVIPTFNRPVQIFACLQSISRLDYPRDRFEVIVVNDGGVSPNIEPFQFLNLSVIDQDNAGPASARNTGASHAKGQFLVFTDDDCSMLPNYLSVLESHCSEQGLIGGKTLNALPHNVFSTASQILIDYLYEYYNRDPNRASFFASNNFAMLRDRFRALGGFHTGFPLAAGEDREFCDRWLAQGYPLLYAPDAQIAHAHSLTLAKFWRQHLNYGRGAYCFHQIRAERQQESIKVEPLKFYWKLLTYPFVCRSTQPPILLSMLLFVSQVANVYGFFLERWQQRRNSGEQVWSAGE